MKIGKKMIDIIIKYEESYKFNDLMKHFDIDIKYENKNSKKFNIKDISVENIKLINDVYHLDFIHYDYEKL